MTRAGTLHQVDGRSVLRFERRLAHPVEKVWRAITEPGQLTHWFPSDMEIDLRVGGRIRFVFRADEGPTLEGTVATFEPPRVLAYTWGSDLLRWELQLDGQGSRLIFTFTFGDRAGAAGFAAGWQHCLDILVTVLDGRPAPALDDYAAQHEAYVEAFGLMEGSVAEHDGGWTVRFERQLPYPIDAVWASMTAAAGPDRAPARPPVGDAPPLRVTNHYVVPGVVTAIDPPALVEYSWLRDAPGGVAGAASPAGRVRWALSDGPGGARVTLTQTGPGELPDARLTALAAWHTHLQLLADSLRGVEHCPWPEARTAALRRHYAQVLHGRSNDGTS